MVWTTALIRGPARPAGGRRTLRQLAPGRQQDAAVALGVVCGQAPLLQPQRGRVAAAFEQGRGALLWMLRARRTTVEVAALAESFPRPRHNLIGGAHSGGGLSRLTAAGFPAAAVRERSALPLPDGRGSGVADRRGNTWLWSRVRTRVSASGSRR